MTPDGLRAAMKRLGVNPVDLSRLLGVTRRAVDFWLMSERAIPGPVAAYLNLMLRLPSKEAALELHRLRVPSL